jgi:predicted DNA-binding transcriptional regulator YafY
VDNEKEFKIELLLVINPELQMRILSSGGNVKVIEPKALKTFVQDEAKKMLK